MKFADLAEKQLDSEHNKNNKGTMAKTIHYFPDGSIRPTCINIGCNKPVALSNGKLESPPTERILRTVCSRCHAASYGALTKTGKVTKLKDGISTYKKNYCENIDGRLGVVCTASNLDSGQLELDHKDGDHNNDDPDNIQTLCKNCHSKKSIKNGDHRQQRQRLQPQPPQLFSSLIPDSAEDSKTDPTLKSASPYTQLTEELENQGCLVLQPNAPFVIS